MASFYDKRLHVMPPAQRRAYAAMCKVAAATGWPEGFVTDLTHHDRCCLMMPDAPKVFGWVLGRHGTWIVRQDLSVFALDGMLAHFRAEATAPRPKVKFFFWDGQALYSVMFSEFESRLRRRDWYGD